MSVKGTPLEIDPTSQVALNGASMEVYQEPLDLPCNEQKRAICEGHLEMGLGDELYSDFWMQGCDFDVAKTEGVVRVQLSCAGQSALRKICRMTLTQFDAQGKVLNTGKIREKVEPPSPNVE